MNREFSKMDMRRRITLGKKSITMFGKQILFAAILLTCTAALSAYAQDAPKPAPVNAGGKWLEIDAQDQMTLAKKTRFELEADNFLRDSSYNKPKIEIFCENGKYKFADLVPNVKLGPPNRPGFWGQPQLEVLVRVDESHSRHGWNWLGGRSLSMDKGTVRELIGAKVFKVEFRTPDGPEIAGFTPADFSLDRIGKACDLTPKKPSNDD
jgi:hypothetical protein